MISINLELKLASVFCFGSVPSISCVESEFSQLGKTVEVGYKGDVSDTLLDILGGLRSACTYVGAGKIKEMPKRTTFIRVTQQLNEVYGSHSGGADRV